MLIIQGMRIKNIRTILLSILILMHLTACSGLMHSLHLASGQLDIMTRARPVDEVMADQAISFATKQNLSRVQAVLQFATVELGLESNDNYRRYVELGREYAIWNVFAAPEFSLSPRQWCYPIAGCVPYRGYFNAARANSYAAGIRQQGLDVFVGGVDAYSTLGWLSDPILSSWLNRSVWSMVATLIHELAHSVVYSPDDPVFNESFASFVEQQGVKRWFTQQSEGADLGEYQHQQQVQTKLIQLFRQSRQKLEIIYRSSQSNSAKRTRKAEIFNQLASQYRVLFGINQSDTNDDSANITVFNNALLVAYSTYNDWIPAFEQLYSRSSNWETFYRSVRQLANLAPSKRQQAMTELLSKR